MRVSSDLLTLRSAFRACRASAHKQLGERAVRDAIALEGRNPARIAELAAKAAHHLAYAEVAR